MMKFRSLRLHALIIPTYVAVIDVTRRRQERAERAERAKWAEWAELIK